MIATPSTIHVACSSSDMYAPLCGAMLHSLKTAHEGQPLVTYFLKDPEVSESTVDKLIQIIPDLQVIRIDPAAHNELQQIGEIPGPQWYRILLPELLPHLDRILYLDSDLIVTRSLQALWATDLTGYSVAAVTNPYPPELAHHVTDDLGLREVTRYFNTGVLLMNLQKMRVDDSIASIKESAQRQRHEIWWPEQDSLNITFSESRLELHPRWNLLASIAGPRGASVFGETMVNEARESPHVVHFEGPPERKPWHYLSTHPYRGQFLEHLRQTPWADWPLEGRTVRNMSIALTRTVKRLSSRLLGQLSRVASKRLRSRKGGR